MEMEPIDLHWSLLGLLACGSVDLFMSLHQGLWLWLMQN